MSLADYINKSGKTRAAWAKDLGVSRGYISDLVNGKRSPGLRLALKIERLSKGAVPVSFWRPEEDAA